MGVYFIKSSTYFLYMYIYTLEAKTAWTTITTEITYDGLHEEFLKLLIWAVRLHLLDALVNGRTTFKKKYM